MGMPRKRRGRVDLGPVLSVANLRALNSYESTGLAPRGIATEALVLTLRDLVRGMERLSAEEEVACRMLAEGFRVDEIATELGCSATSAARCVRQVEWTLFGVDVSDAQRKQAAGLEVWR